MIIAFFSTGIMWVGTSILPVVASLILFSTVSAFCSLRHQWGYDNNNLLFLPLETLQLGHDSDPIASKTIGGFIPV